MPEQEIKSKKVHGEHNTKEIFIESSDPTKDAKIIKKIAETYGEALNRLRED